MTECQESQGDNTRQDQGSKFEYFFCDVWRKESDLGLLARFSQAVYGRSTAKEMVALKQLKMLVSASQTNNGNLTRQTNSSPNSVHTEGSDLWAARDWS